MKQETGGSKEAGGSKKTRGSKSHGVREALGEETAGSVEQGTGGSEDQGFEEAVGETTTGSGNMQAKETGVCWSGHR